VGNPGFETGKSGWNTNGGASGITLDQVAGGHSGTYAAKLSNANSSSGDCLLNDSPNWLKVTSAGACIGSMWVRADSPGATFTLRFREYSTSGTRLGVSTTRIKLTTDWQYVDVTLPVTSPGSTLDFNAHVMNAAPGTCFYADDAAIVEAPVKVITFDEFTGADNASYVSKYLNTMGFSFISGYMHIINNSEGCTPDCISDGTPYLSNMGGPYGGPTVRMAQPEGGTFELTSLDGGPNWVSDPPESYFYNAAQIYVVGTKADTSQVQATLVFSGAGAFQHFTLPNTFTHLKYVNFWGDNATPSTSSPGGGFSLDNITVVPRT